MIEYDPERRLGGSSGLWGTELTQSTLVLNEFSKIKESGKSSCLEHMG